MRQPSDILGVVLDPIKARVSCQTRSHKKIRKRLYLIFKPSVFGFK
jgi:hypothetical protein